MYVARQNNNKLFYFNEKHAASVFMARRMFNFPVHFELDVYTPMIGGEYRYIETLVFRNLEAFMNLNNLSMIDQAEQKGIMLEDDLVCVRC